MPKTRNACGGRKLFASVLFDFNEWHKICSDDMTKLPEMNSVVIAEIERLKAENRHVTNHIMRLIHYQANTTETTKLERVRGLIRQYYEFNIRINRTLNELEKSLEDNAAIERRSFMKRFAPRLKEARKAKMMTQAEVAERVGIKRAAYGAYESARNEPPVSTLARLARVLERTPNELLGF